MTVQEAIKYHLKPLKKRAFAHTTETALDMAIESMEEVEQYRALGTVEELKEARKKQKSRREWYQKGYQDGLNADKWISCEERLPEERLQSVIGWDEYRQRCCLVRYDKEWILGNYDSVKITHWQPLPTQPYKKEGAE